MDNARRIQVTVAAVLCAAALMLVTIAAFSALRPASQAAAPPEAPAEPAAREVEWDGQPLEKNTSGAADSAFGLSEEDPAEEEAPRTAAMRLTIPKLERITETPIPTAPGTDTEALDANAAVHLEGTGYPWQDGANTYVAGHRLGYAGTPSENAFRDLDRLEKGDEILVTDARGEEYRYVVYDTFEVDPTDVRVTEEVPNKSVLTLQTCTLPDYAKRLIVRAEKQA